MTSVEMLFGISITNPSYDKNSFFSEIIGFEILTSLVSDLFSIV